MTDHTSHLAGQLLSGSQLTIVEWTAEATPERVQQAPLHLHRGEDEIWYVLDGALGFSLGGEEVVVPAGGGVIARAGVPHTYWNAVDLPTRYLLVMQRRTAALVGAIHDPAQRKAMTLPALFLHYDSELLEAVQQG